MNTDQATRRVEWLIVRYLYPDHERDQHHDRHPSNPYFDHPDQLVTSNPYTR